MVESETKRISQFFKQDKCKFMHLKVNVKGNELETKPLVTDWLKDIIIKIRIKFCHLIYQRTLIFYLENSYYNTHCSFSRKI